MFVKLDLTYSLYHKNRSFQIISLEKCVYYHATFSYFFFIFPFFSCFCIFI